jgi:hypothetical protein
MTALRNLAIGAIHLLRRRDITEPPTGQPAAWTAHSKSLTHIMILKNPCG